MNNTSTSRAPEHARPDLDPRADAAEAAALAVIDSNGNHG